MRRTLQSFAPQLLFVVFGIVPAFGQQPALPSSQGQTCTALGGWLVPQPRPAWPRRQLQLPLPLHGLRSIRSPRTPGWTPNRLAHNGEGHIAGQVYDPATNTMIVFGGFDAGLAGELTNAVLLLANANGSGTWSTLIDNGAIGSPTARAGHTAVDDSANNRMIVFGGCMGAFGTGCPTPFNDVWVLSGANGHGGTPVWTQLSPTGTSPAARWSHTAVYDAANNRMIIFAGYNETLSFNDVWVLSNANGLGGTPAWTKLSTSGGPPNGIGAASAVYDPVNNIMTVLWRHQLCLHGCH